MRNGLKSVLLCGALVMCVGCQIEHAPSRTELKEQKAEAKQDKAGTPKEVPLPQVDQAQQVLAACGPAASDRYMVVHDHVDNGQVREMRYAKPAEVVLKFIPARPPGEILAEGAQLPVLPIRPVNEITWSFSEAHMQEQSLLTAESLRVYLPCASRALRGQD